MNQTTNAGEQVLASVNLIIDQNDDIGIAIDMLNVETAAQIMVLEELIVQIRRLIWELSPQNKLDAPPTMPVAGPEMGVEAIEGGKNVKLPEDGLGGAECV